MGEWSIVSGTGGSFNDNTDPSAIFTGLDCSEYELRWSISTLCGTSYSDVNIKFDQSPTTAYAGTNQTITTSATSTTLAANTPIEGTGEWSIVSGTGGSFADPSNPTTTFTGQSCKTYLLKWTISTPCRSSQSTVNVTFNHTPTPADAGEIQCVTGGITSTTLEANTPSQGNGVWSIVQGTGGFFSDVNNPNSVFMGNANSSYTLRWTIVANCNSSYNDVLIQFYDNEAQCLLW